MGQPFFRTEMGAATVEMDPNNWSLVSRDFMTGFAGGLIFAVLLALVLGTTALRMTDHYGLGHWKLNLRAPLSSMWMNVGYWRDDDDNQIEHFDEAALALLKQLLSAAGLLIPKSPTVARRGALAVLDLGFGCGDQTWHLARLTASGPWSDFRYVGLTLNEAQVQTASRKICRAVASATNTSASASASADLDIRADTFKLFRADAARPATWPAPVADAVRALADERFTDRWLVALDCLYHFSPSRRPVFAYAARELGARVAAFDLLLSEGASWRERLVLRAVGVFMGCPVGTFLVEDAYRDQLVECGYDRDGIEIRDITDHVFSGLVRFLDGQERALGEYGVSLGGFKLAGRLFDWFARSGVVRAVVVIARTVDKSAP
ncbi:hypothetical protein BN1723_007602 [Verticillium longisporum]|uniref:Methyltransferase domain-containing protein n=1 Tax=Verticillium longisporum TaxID=100787 RepID=A0A0G4NM56_VERLO|nr:hypothetical protein BN1723_007602 [Verticillium longisporum]